MICGALAALIIAACPGGGATTGSATTEASTATGASATTGTGTSVGSTTTTGSTMASTCIDAPGCPCGTLGCACDSGDSCLVGTCTAATGTCTEERDGMMHVPAGPFWMGCREGIDTDALTGPCPVRQLPYREVTVSAFWIDRTEVTKGAYRECMDAGVCVAPPRWDKEWNIGEEGNSNFVPGLDEMPAASITWTQAKTYCAWRGKRLPTEAEWEKAARGVDGRKYPWGMDEPTCEHANFKPWDVEANLPGPECPYRAMYATLTPVGMFCGRGASVYGVCDMSGNVAEWAADGYDAAGYEGLPAVDPFREPVGDTVARRGSGWGSWSLSAIGYSLRTSWHKGGGKDDGGETLETGFRCAAST